MAIKKGIVVLDGTTEVHKLTDDGNVVINAPETAFEPAELKGNVMVEGVSDDLVKTLLSLDSDIQAESAAARAAEASAQGEADQWYTTTDADFTSRHGTLSTTLGTATANRIADYAALSAAGSTLNEGTVDVNISQMSAQQSSGTAYRGIAEETVLSNQDTLKSALDDVFFNSTITGSFFGMVSFANAVDTADEAAVSVAMDNVEGDLSSQVSFREETYATAVTSSSAETSIREEALNVTIPGLYTAEFNAQAAESSAVEAHITAERDTANQTAWNADEALQLLIRNKADATAATEESARLAADADLEAMLVADEAIYNTARSSAQTRMALIVNTRIAEMNNVSSSIDQEAQDRAAAITSSETHMNSEFALVDAKELEKENDIETLRSMASGSAKAANEDLQKLVDDQETARIAQIAGLTNDLNAAEGDYNGDAALKLMQLANLSSRRVSNISALSSSADNVQATLADILQVDNGEAVTNLVELVSFIDNIDGANDQAIADAISTLNTDLANQAGARVQDDATVQGLIDAEEATRTAAVQVKDDAYASMEADHIVRSGSMNTLMQNHFSTLTSYVDTTESDWTSGALLAESGSRHNADVVIYGRIADELNDRGVAVNSLSTVRQGADAVLNTRITNLQTTLTTGELTLSGLLDGASEVNIDGTLAVGSHATVPVAYQAGDQSAHDGKMFYLTAPSAVEGFEEGNKWYFCEGGQWHASTFLTDTDGDGYRDQFESILGTSATDASEPTVYHIFNHNADAALAQVGTESGIYAALEAMESIIPLMYDGGILDPAEAPNHPTGTGQTAAENTAIEKINALYAAFPETVGQFSF